MRAALLLMALGLGLRCEAATYWVDPQPALSPSASALASHAFYLAAFKDVRHQKELWKGNSNFDAVRVSAQDLSLQAGAWGSWDYSAVSFLWHRQLGHSLAEAGFSVQEAGPPGPPKEAEAAARLSGCAFVLEGELRRLDIGKRGSDEMVGTNFSGTDFTFELDAKVQLKSLSAGAAVLAKDFSFKHKYHDPTSMGSPDRETFPLYFLQGLQAAAESMSADKDLRRFAGLPALAPTPTPSPSPSPAALQTPTPALAAPVQPAPSPSPTVVDQSPYWVNPKTGNRVDPAWNFDPSDGTPRKDFVLRQYSAPTSSPSSRPGN